MAVAGTIERTNEGVINMTTAISEPQVDEIDETTEDVSRVAGSKETQFSSRVVPWMKLGQLVETVVTAAEAAKLGGIDFEVREEDIYRATKVQGRPPHMKKIEGRKALVRVDTDEQLSIVSAEYPVVQYGEAFDFMNAVSPQFVAAGALRGGRQGFMVVDTGINMTVADDTSRLYGVLRTSHDCSRAVEVSAMPLRQKCMNQLTLNSFTKGAEYRWSIVHAGDVKTKLKAAKESMSRLSLYAQAFESNVKKLLGVKIDDERATEVLRFALPDRPKRDDMIQQIITGWHDHPDTVGYDGTGWGLVNAVSEHFEWARQHGTPESRFLGALQGPTRNAINKTATYLLTRV